MESGRERIIMTPKRVRLFLALLAVTSLAGLVHAQTVVITSNYADDGPVIHRGWDKDLWWHQDAAANRDGYISEIGIYMGLNTVPYDATLVIYVNGAKVFAHVYKGLQQRSSDWATVFPVTGSNVHVKHGDTIRLSLAPHAPVNYVSSTKISPAWSIPTYGPFAKMVMRCFITGTTSPLY